MTVSNVMLAIENLNEVSLNDEYAYEKAILAYLKIKRFPVLVYNIPAGTTVFRTRTHTSNDYFEAIDQVTLPPNANVKEFARCNRPYQSIFYCSENRPTSYMELINGWADSKNVGDNIYVTIGRWVLKREFRAIIITSPDVENRISEFDLRHGKVLDHFIGNSQAEIRDATAEFYRYLFNIFSMPVRQNLNTYILTTAYCNLAIVQLMGVADGFYYPSVPFAGQGVNFAINSSFVNNENMELVDVYRNEITISSIDSGIFNFVESNLIRASKIDINHNTIKW